MSFYLWLFEKLTMNLSLYISAMYIFVKALNLKLDKKSALLSAFIVVLLRIIIIQFNYSYTQIIFIILTALSFIIIDKRQHKNIFIRGIISIGIAYGLLYISIFSVAITLGLIGVREINEIQLIAAMLLEIFLAVFFTKLKRFKNGFLFFQENESLGVGLIISGILVIITCIDVNGQGFSNDTLALIAVGALISFAGVVIWIRRTITLRYKKRMEARAEVYYQNQLQEKDKYIEQLTSSNEFLSKIVHRDNHLMSALEYTLKQCLESTDENQKTKIIKEILTMVQERSELVRKEQINSKVLPSTDISIIDGALGDMYVKASAHNIDFDLVISEKIHYLVNDFISQTDLETLLCDHIKDAIIAIDSNKEVKGRILVSFTVTNGIYEISVKDNGIDFDIDTFKKLGLERVTTHKDSGGSGIGFMTTFETLDKSKASLYIIEYQEKQPFSKSVNFRFDGQGNFFIKTYRKDELEHSINRKDLKIIGG